MTEGNIDTSAVTGIRRVRAARLSFATASSLLAIAAASPALADDTPSNGSVIIPVAQTQAQDGAGAPAQIDEAQADDIVVTGLRGSLQRNLDIKRTSAGVVDAISSEDIGKFPDSNVAASLQRLPGVSIQRAGARGEPQGITVRGFGGDFNETLYDGRRISTATGGRAVDFSTVGADFVGQLSVLKTPDVTLSSSSIGATVNVEFPKPFDYSGMRLVATASGSIQDDAGKVVPTAGLLFSDTFAGDTFGVLVSGMYTRHDTQTNRAFVSGWPGGRYAPCQLAGTTATSCSPTSDPNNAAYADPNNRQTVVGWFEQQYGASQIYTRDERVDGRIALQWRPSNGLLLTLDNNFSRQTIRADNFGFGIWFNQGSLRNVELDENGTTVDFSQAGSQTDFTAGTDRSVLQTNQTGLNLKWDASENLKLEADASYAKSWLNPDGRISSDNADVGYGFAIGPALGIRIDGSSKDTIPVLHDYGPGGDASRWADPTVMGSHVTVRQASKNTDELKQGRLSASWEQEGFRIKIGGQYVEDHFQFQQRNTFANNYWQAYSGYGSPSGNTTGVLIPASLFTDQVSTRGFIPGFSGALPPVLLKFDARAYQQFLEGLGNPQAQNIPGFNYTAPTVGTNFTGAFDLALDNGSIRDITEKSWALFARANFDTEIAGMPFHFNAGIRQENTHLTAIGLGQVPLSIIQNAGDPTLLTVVLSDPQRITTKTSYSYLLPSIDMKLELTDKFHLRFDASRTLTRPSLNLLTPVLNVGTGQRVGALTANGGNPGLKPYLADNFDFAAEWYYQSNSYASVNFFLKNVSNFIVGGTQRQTINDVVDPTTGQPAQFAVTQQINGPDATVRGVEIAWQHVFGNSGFGFNANATFVDTNKPYDAEDISQSGFAVTGLANSANFVGFYDKNGFEARVALNWRDEYLLQFGQNQNTGSFGSEPTFVNSSLQIDFSTSYQLTKQVNVFFEALNITNETMSTHGRFDNQLLDVFAYGRRFTAGARFRF
ncbi:TonB-dependent receptor [Sphingomonas cannabina]|uniref:TonB-dependent receptor n=1 Tax=Sphingomonas cannabina TaxID=2899123 RepID=UPI001F21501B|nr:TonB-dependent receptor [Sphingomonas cannabina]UIJ46657.1 TonB-dependent receptor [Sphingomonas cannabina]